MEKQREVHWVEVKLASFDFWVKRIAIDLKCNPVLCVEPNYKEQYLNFEAYDTERWDKWREIQEPEWVPYETMEECFEDLKDVWIRYKNTPTLIVKITQFDFKNNTLDIDNWTCTLDHVFETFEKLDGTPCGKLKEFK
jgi:hypothetical protein